MWFTDQKSESIEIEDNVNLTLIIGLTLSKRDTQQNQYLENMLR